MFSFQESFFEDISYMLNGREVPDIFSNEDKERIFLSLRKDAMDRGVSNEKHAVFDHFKQRMNDHIHFAISMSPSGTLFRQRCRVYPSLINCCAIDWYDEWPSDALEAVGNAFLQSVEITGRNCRISFRLFPWVRFLQGRLSLGELQNCRSVNVLREGVTFKLC